MSGDATKMINGEMASTMPTWAKLMPLASATDGKKGTMQLNVMEELNAAMHSITNKSHWPIFASK